MSTPIYEAIPGFFVHDTESHQSLTLPPIPPRLGLLDDSASRWHDFRKKIAELDENARKEDGSVKVFFLPGMVKAGITWLRLSTERNTGMTDPELTPVGINQAVEARRGWEAEIAHGVTLPDKLYSSPLTRAMDTLRVTFEGLLWGEVDKQRTVLVVENCREENGIHTCDQRRTRSYIHKRFPTFEFEEGFTEEDERWDPEIRETKAEVAKRAHEVLDSIFQRDMDSTYISVTAHGGIINGFLQALGRPPFPLLTGGILPVVVKCKRR